MIRCTLEVAQKAQNTKVSERAGAALDGRPVVGFEDLRSREGHLWRMVDTPHALRALGERVRDCLCHDEYRAFVALMVRVHGMGVARRAGLVDGRPTLVLAS